MSNDETRYEFLRDLKVAIAEELGLYPWEEWESIQLNRAVARILKIYEEYYSRGHT